MSNLPKHIAIIMDGNGRWANLKGLQRSAGHKKGAEVVHSLSIFCAQKHIQCLTLYAFSTENWNRPKTEINFLMRLLEEYLKKEKQTYIDNNLRFKTIGDKSPFSKRLQNLIVELENDTQNNTGMTQVLALNYGGKNEIARSVLKTLQNGDLTHDMDGNKIESKIEQNLDTASLPPLDMIIRTGGEFRISNFLLWQAAYSEMFFTSTLFPDFTNQELENMLNDFAKRIRKYGGLL